MGKLLLLKRLLPLKNLNRLLEYTMNNKTQLLNHIITNTIDNKPSEIGPAVNKIMASKIKEIIDLKKKEISKQY